jgi:hypothetical protein
VGDILYRATFSDDEGVEWGIFDNIEDAKEWIKEQAYYIDVDNEYEWWLAEVPPTLRQQEKIIYYWNGEFQAVEENEPIHPVAWIEKL